MPEGIQLDFERPIIELEKKISDMKDFSVGEKYFGTDGDFLLEVNAGGVYSWLKSVFCNYLATRMI